jgi:hypothetical protein
MTELETPKTDFYIRLDSEEDLSAVFAAFYRQDTTTEFDEATQEYNVVNVGDPYLVKVTKHYAIDIVGIVTKSTGNTITDPESGIEFGERLPVSGWHVNVRLVGDEFRTQIEAIDTEYGVIPTHPRRVWA